jgi:DNA polymerase-3 subunit epsilon
MDFVVIDVETASPDISSICQVGIASFRDGELAESWVSLVNPECDFNPFNVSIHGIDEDRVHFAPTWPQIFSQIDARLQDRIVVSHTPFDRHALARACERFELPECACTWLDSARVVRLAWPQFSKSGYGLPNVARHFGIEYRAHDALEDARCAGLLLLRAVAETGLTPQQWLARLAQTSGQSRRSRSRSQRREANPNGELLGEVLVFTGLLAMPRSEAADAAAAVGCRVDDAVTESTTMLVVGRPDGRAPFGGYAGSSKLRAAERMAKNGLPIRILGESDFLEIVAQRMGDPEFQRSSR